MYKNLPFHPMFLQIWSCLLLSHCTAMTFTHREENTRVFEKCLLFLRIVQACSIIFLKYKKRRKKEKKIQRGMFVHAVWCIVVLVISISVQTVPMSRSVEVPPLGLVQVRRTVSKNLKLHQDSVSAFMHVRSSC